MRSLLLSPGVFLAIGILAGCGIYSAPKLSVAEARLSQRTDDGFVIAFDLDATNDNAIELPLARVEYTVWLDDQRVFSGMRSPEASLRRLGTQRITLPAAISSDIPIEAGEAEYRLQGRLTYLIPGRLAEVLFDAGVLRPTVGFGDEGVIDLRSSSADMSPHHAQHALSP